MKNLITTEVLSILVTSCSVFGSLTTNVTIKANENFVLGNNEHGTFKARIKNVSNHAITIAMHPINGGSYSPETILPNESTTVKTERNTALVIENKSDDSASIDLHINGDTGLSMGYKIKSISISKNRIQKLITMKNSILLLAILFTNFTSFSQLRGSGKTVTKTYDYQNFDKVNFNDLDGKLEIEVGKPFSISITIDDNLINLLTLVENTENKLLTISLKGNQNNKMYIEDTKIKVKITMPFLVEVSNNGNSGLTVTNINSKNFKSENPVNGSTTLFGIVDNLEVICRGNGNLNATKLITKTAKITCRGNGNAKVNAKIITETNRSGNGNIENVFQ
jgi:Putative auto-transporter adhesin, head GIN domain